MQNAHRFNYRNKIWIRFRKMDEKRFIQFNQFKEWFTSLYSNKSVRTVTQTT